MKFPTLIRQTVASYQPFELTLELRRHPDVVNWTCQAGFLPRPMSLGILGTKGFFELFDLSRINIEILP